MKSRLPPPKDTAKIRQFDIATLYYSIGEGDLFGFNLPAFQRELVWTQKQNNAFLESVWLRLPIGMYMVNDITQTQEFICE